MPELPEVETVVRGLKPRLLGLRIESVELRHKQVLRGAVARAAGWTIAEVRLAPEMVEDFKRGVMVAQTLAPR